MGQSCSLARVQNANKMGVVRFIVSLFIAFAVGSALWASEPLKGWVVDRNGAPINGAKVYAKHRKSHTESNDMGEFCLSDVDAVKTIHVKIKKKVYDVAVGGRTSLYIVISDLPIVGNENINEDIGPRTIVYGDELVKFGQTDLVQALRGRLSGVYVKGDGRIKMSRASSLHLSTDPVWIVDGVIGGVPPSVHDVESVEIDKEGLGYGLHGANGVIIVTTKRFK